MLKKFFSENEANPIKAIFSIIALTLLIVHLFQPSLQIDAISLGLLLAVAVPWLSYFVKSAKLPGGWEFEFQELKNTVQHQEQKIQNQQAVIQDQQELINQLTKYSMSASIFHHLCGIALLKDYTYNNDDATRREMYFLRDSGLIRPKSYQFLVFDDSLSGKNLVDIAEPTEVGWICFNLRKNEIPSNMLTDTTNWRFNPMDS